MCEEEKRGRDCCMLVLLPDVTKKKKMDSVSVWKERGVDTAVTSGLCLEQGKMIFLHLGTVDDLCIKELRILGFPGGVCFGYCVRTEGWKGKSRCGSRKLYLHHSQQSWCCFDNKSLKATLVLYLHSVIMCLFKSQPHGVFKREQCVSRRKVRHLKQHVRGDME